MNCKKGIIIIFIILIILFIFKNYDKNTTNINIFKHNSKKYNYDKLGDTYFYGTYEIEPDYVKATENYNRVFMYDPDNENIPQIRQNLNNIINHNNEDNTNRIVLNDLEFGFHNDINDYILDINFDDNLPVLPPFDFNDAFENPPNDRRYYNDFENVHDSVVNKTINTSIKNLEETTTQNNNLDEINKYLLENLKNSNLSIDDKEKVKKTINYIKQNSNSKIVDRKLEDNLILIGNRIKNNELIEQGKDMRENLYQELKDCVRTDGNMYCYTGISNRIINSLHGIDDAVKITPKWALREELMRKCSKIREDLEKNKSQDDEDFTEKLKENIRTELKKEYVEDNKILKEDDLNKEIKDWIEYV